MVSKYTPNHTNITTENSPNYNFYALMMVQDSKKEIHEPAWQANLLNEWVNEWMSKWISVV